MTTPTQHLLSEQEIDAITNQAREHEWTSHQHAHAIVAAYAAKLAQGVELRTTAWAMLNKAGELKSARWGTEPPSDETLEIASIESCEWEPLIRLSTAQAAVAAERVKLEHVTTERNSFERVYREAMQSLREAVEERDALKGKLDALMLEHCPDEMTPEQLETWRKHQRPLSGEESGAINKALRRSAKFIDSAPPAPAAEPVPNGFANALSIRAANGWDLKGGAVPVLYTDEINGQQVGRDDVWLCTTAALKQAAPSPSPAVPADRAGLVEECKRLANEQAAATAGLMLVQEGDQEGNVRLLDRCRSAVEATHAAIDRLASAPAQVAEGWQLVPKEPTDAMLEAGALALEQSKCHDFEGPAEDVFAAMLAAAPAAGGEQV